MPDILIVDGMNLFLRQWSANPAADSNGAHVGGTMGSLRAIKNMVRDTDCSRVIVAWEGEGGSRRRRGVYAEYKSGRKPRVNRSHDLDTPREGYQNLEEQRLRLVRYLSYLGANQVSVSGCEADDVVSVVCSRWSGLSKVIVSTDQDFFQLVDPRTSVYSPTRRVMYDEVGILAETGCSPKNFIFMKTICGDGSDNVKGIRGLGPKTLLRLFPQLSGPETSLSELLEAAEALRPNRPSEIKLLKSLLESRQLLIDNFRVMQLSSPSVPPQSVTSILNQASSQAQVNMTAFKLAVARDGLQLTDPDFFVVFGAYSKRLAEASREAV